MGTDVFDSSPRQVLYLVAGLPISTQILYPGLSIVKIICKQNMDFPVCTSQAIHLPKFFSGTVRKISNKDGGEIRNSK